MEQIIDFGLYIRFIFFKDHLPLVQIFIKLLNNILHVNFVVLLLVPVYLDLAGLFLDGFAKRVLIQDIVEIVLAVMISIHFSVPFSCVTSVFLDMA